MKLILHIGTHKTATTSIQHFCALRRKKLKQNGILYPHNPDSAYVMNNLAAQIVHGKEEQTQNFLNKSLETAKKCRAHSVVISGESFYAMTNFFKLLAGEKMTREAYFSNEEKYIKIFRDYCQIFDSIDVFCTFRAQEEYANALYNQLIKNTRGIDQDYLSFLDTINFALDYSSHIKIWEKYFGQNNLHLVDFDTIKPNPTKYFCDVFLGTPLYSDDGGAIHSNKRLSRDVLEFKRIQNTKTFDRAKAFVSIQAYHQLSEEFPDAKNWQIFVPLSERQNIFSKYDDGNAVLKRDYNLQPLQTMSIFEDSDYPGLSDDKARCIQERLDALLSKPASRTEYLIRHLVHKMIARFSFLDQLLNPVRSMRNSIRLKLEGW